MSIVNSYSTALTTLVGRDKPRKKGLFTDLKVQCDVVEVEVGDADSVVAFHIRIPVNARIHSVKLYSDDLGTTGDIDIGFYRGDHRYGLTGATADAPVVADAVDRDAIGSAVDVNAAALSGSELRFETKDISTINQEAWELAGLSALPSYRDFFLWGSLTEATTTKATLGLVVYYSV